MFGRPPAPRSAPSRPRCSSARGREGRQDWRARRGPPHHAERPRRPRGPTESAVRLPRSRRAGSWAPVSDRSARDRCRPGSARACWDGRRRHAAPLRPPQGNSGPGRAWCTSAWGTAPCRDARWQLRDRRLREFPFRAFWPRQGSRKVRMTIAPHDEAQHREVILRSSLCR